MPTRSRLRKVSAKPGSPLEALLLRGEVLQDAAMLTSEKLNLLATDSVIAALVDENRLSQMLMQLSFRKIIRVHQAAAASSGEQKLERCELVSERSPPTPGRQSRAACSTSQQHDIHRNVMIIRMLQRAKLHYQRSVRKIIFYKINIKKYPNCI